MGACPPPEAFCSTEAVEILVGKHIRCAVCLCDVHRTCLAILLRPRVLHTNLDLLRLPAPLHAEDALKYIGS